MVDNTLAEFLVELGVKSDEAGFKKAFDGIGKLQKSAAGLTTELVAMEAAVVGAATVVAGQFEDLFFSTQRLGSSAAQIKSFRFAVGQMGGSADSAQSSMEGLAHFLRSNGAGGWASLRSLGVTAQDTVGQLDQLAHVFANMAKSSPNGYALAEQYAQLFGINEQTLMSMIRAPDELKKQEDAYQSMVNRVFGSQKAFDGASKSSHDFMNQIRGLGAYLSLLSDKYLADLQGPIGRMAKGLEDLDRAAGGASTAAIALGAALAPMLMFFGPGSLVVAGVAALGLGVAALWDSFENWKAGADTLIDWSQWAPQIDAALDGIQSVKDALTDLVNTSKPLVHDFAQQWQKEWGESFGQTMHKQTNTFVNAAIDELHMLADAIRVVGSLLGTLGPLLHGDGAGALKAWKGGYAASQDFWKDTFRDDTKPRDGSSASAAARAKAIADGASGSGSSALDDMMAAMRGGGAAAHMSALQQQRAAFAVAYLKSQGLSDQAARGAVAGAIAESNGLDPNARNPTSGAYGLGQWLGPRQSKLFAMFGRNPTFDQQLQYLAQELKGGDPGGASVTGAGSDSQAALAYITRFMRPGQGHDTIADLSRARSALAALGVTNGAPLGDPNLLAAANGNGHQVNFSQSTVINVHGSDAQSAAKEVVNAQGRVNGNLLRNLKTAVI